MAVYTVIADDDKIKNTIVDCEQTNKALKKLVYTSRTFIDNYLKISPYQKKPEQLTESDRKKAYGLDAVDLKVESEVIEDWILQIKMENEILDAANTCFQEYLWSKVKGWLNLQAWSNWKNLPQIKIDAQNELAKSIEEIRSRYHKLFEESRDRFRLNAQKKQPYKKHKRDKHTEKGRILAQFNADEMGQFIREKIYEPIKLKNTPSAKAVSTNSSSSSSNTSESEESQETKTEEKKPISFGKVYKGIDNVQDTLETEVDKATTFLWHCLCGDRQYQDANGSVVTFTPPKGTVMAKKWIAAKELNTHRLKWHAVLVDLKTETDRALENDVELPNFDLTKITVYQEKYKTLEGLMERQRSLLKDLHRHPLSDQSYLALIPATSLSYIEIPFDLLFTEKPELLSKKNEKLDNGKLKKIVIKNAKVTDACFNTGRKVSWRWVEEPKVSNSSSSSLSLFSSARWVSVPGTPPSSWKKVTSQQKIFENFTSIDLSTNLLVNPAKEVFPTGLVELILDNNTLTTLDFILGLPNLEELSAAHNQIKYLPNLVTTGKLKKLNVSHNSLEDIDPLKSLTALVEVDVSSNKIASLRSLDCHTSLVVLKANNNVLSAWENSLPNMLTALETLEVDGNNDLNLKTNDQLFVQRFPKYVHEIKSDQ